MKRCGTCGRNFTDDTLRFCLYDGQPLTDAPAAMPTPPAGPYQQQPQQHYPQPPQQQQVAPQTPPQPPALPAGIMPPGATPPPLPPVAQPHQQQQQQPAQPPVPQQYTPQVPPPPPAQIPQAPEAQQPYVAPQQFPQQPQQYGAQPPQYGVPQYAAPPQNIQRTGGSGGGGKVLGIIAAIVVGLLLLGRMLAGVSGRTQNGKQDPNNTPVVATQPTEDPNGEQPNTEPVNEGNGGQETSPQSDLRAEITSAARLASEAEAKASASLSTDGLEDSYSGDALQAELLHIQQLRSAGQVQEQSLENQEFGNLNVSNDGKLAELEVVETWTGTIYNQSNRQVVQHWDSRRVPQTMHMERDGDSWKVRQVEFPTQ